MLTEINLADNHGRELTKGNINVKWQQPLKLFDYYLTSNLVHVVVKT